MLLTLLMVVLALLVFFVGYITGSLLMIKTIKEVIDKNGYDASKVMETRNEK